MHSSVVFRYERRVLSCRSCDGQPSSGSWDHSSICLRDVEVTEVQPNGTDVLQNTHRVMAKSTFSWSFSRVKISVVVVFNQSYLRIFRRDGKSVIRCPWYGCRVAGVGYVSSILSYRSSTVHTDLFKRKGICHHVTILYLSSCDAFAIFFDTKNVNSPNDTTPSEADSAVPVSCSAFVRTLGRRVANALLA